MDEDDDDSESYFAFNNDDMLPSKVVATAVGGEAALTGSFAPSNSSQVAETSIPNFLLKLWRLVEDNRYSQCIGWDSTGFSFHVREPYGFSKDVLPLYFKHSNLNSFIRQLNMYGFRKVTNLEKGALKQQTDQDSLEFQHPYFVRGHPELLQYIKRKISNPRAGGEIDVHQQSTSVRGFNQVLEDLRQLREKQVGMDARLNHIKKENGALWREVAHMRQLHMKQQQVVNKLIQFLLSLVQPATGKRLGKRQLLAIGPGLLAEHQHDRDEPAGKRLRSDSNSSANSAVQIIESLEQELQNSGRLSFVTPAGIRRSLSGSGGPIIADVTDELETYDMNEQGQQAEASGVTSLSVAGVQRPAVGAVPRTAAQDIYGRQTTLSTEGDVGSIGASILQAPSSTQALGNLSFDVLSSNGLVGYKESDSFPNLVTPGVPATLAQSNSISPQAAQLQEQQMPGTTVQQQQHLTTTTRPVLNRGFSDTDGLAQPVIYSGGGGGDWAVRSGAAPEGDQGKWSKPEFSEYLDFVQTDLDSLKDFLASGSFSVDQDSLSNLFTMADENNTIAANAPQPEASEAAGNEVQLYKRPEWLGNVAGATDMARGCETSQILADTSAAVGDLNSGSNVDRSTVTGSAVVTLPPRAVSVSQLPRPAQSRRPVSSTTVAIRPNEQPLARPSVKARGNTTDPLLTASSGLTAATIGTTSSSVAGQPVLVLAPRGELQQGIVYGVQPRTTEQIATTQVGRRESLRSNLDTSSKTESRR